MGMFNSPLETAANLINSRAQPAYTTITNEQQAFESPAVLGKQLYQAQLEIFRTQINDLVDSSNWLNLCPLFPLRMLTIARGSASYSITGIRKRGTTIKPGQGWCLHRIPDLSHESNTTLEKCCNAYINLPSSQARNITRNNVLPIRYSSHCIQTYPIQDGLAGCSDCPPPPLSEQQLRTWAVIDYAKKLGVPLMVVKDYAAHQRNPLVERARNIPLQDQTSASVKSIKEAELRNPPRGLDFQNIKDCISREIVHLYQIFGPFILLCLYICGMVAVSVIINLACVGGRGWCMLAGLLEKWP